MVSADKKASTTKVEAEPKAPRISKLERLTIEIAKAKEAEETKRAAKLDAKKAELEKAVATLNKAAEKVDALTAEVNALKAAAPLVTDGIGEAPAPAPVESEEDEEV